MLYNLILEGREERPFSRSENIIDPWMGAHLNVKGLVFRVWILGDEIMEYLQLLIMAWAKYFYGN